jgi:mycothiol synthase
MSTGTALVGAAPSIPGLTFRPATPDDWETMARVRNAARAADGLDEIISAEVMAAQYPPSDTFRLERDCVLALVDGEVIAQGFGSWTVRGGLRVGEVDGDVHPDYRRRGLGTALIRSAIARLRAEAAADTTQEPRELRAWAVDEQLSALALIEAEGFQPVRYGFEMRRPLTGSLPVHPLPAGLSLRPVVEADHRAIFDADNEAFRDHWGSREFDESDFQWQFHGPDADPSLWVVAWDGDQVAGAVMNVIYRSENEALGIRRGWLDHVSVRRPWRRRGLARAMCALAFEVLRDAGMDEAWLGVDGTNPMGALQLYEDLGFQVARRWRAFGRPLDGPAPQGWVTIADAPDPAETGGQP